jgi:hypothetical protein
MTATPPFHAPSARHDAGHTVHNVEAPIYRMHYDFVLKPAQACEAAA